MDHAAIERFFTRSDGNYLFARWGRPIVPVVFGVDDATLGIVKGAIEAVVALADYRMSDTDPELGANLLMFFFREWDELLETPDLDRLVPDLGPLVDRLKAGDANQYRLFRFDEAGAIKAAFVFVRMDAALAELPAEDLALAQAAETIVLWSDTAFREKGPLGEVAGRIILRPDVAAVIRAAYDPVMPAVTDDPSHALRLAARVGSVQ
ncbi:MAG: hypothetical protein QNJ35_02270 [Paracoccaceae bacterium]|nr:hypothetical protein [Paracoccaceae bacterium]